MLRRIFIPVFVFVFGIVWGCGADTAGSSADAGSDSGSDNDSGTDSNSEGDADTDGGSDDCVEIGGCVLGCRGSCCPCPEVVAGNRLGEEGWFASENGVCRSTYAIVCDPCPPTPVPVCHDGGCVAD